MAPSRPSNRGPPAPRPQRGQIRSFLAEAEVEPSREYVEWFGWHDGVTTESKMAPATRMATLQECMDLYLVHVRPDYREDDTNVGWFPLATLIDGCVVVTDCTGRSPDLAVTTTVEREGNLLGPEYHLPSLATPVSWWVELFANDTWTRNRQYPEAIHSTLDDGPYPYPQIARYQAFVC